MGKSGNTGEVPTVGMLWQLKAPTADAIQDALAYAREKYGEPRTAMLNPAVKVDATGLGVNVVPPGHCAGICFYTRRNKLCS